MVETRPGLRGRAGGLGPIVVGASLLAVVTGAGAFAAVTKNLWVLVVLLGVVLAVSGAAWLQARAAFAASEKAAADLDHLANRLIQVEARLAHQQSAAAGTEPALRSTVEEVTGEIGILGGIVRDLAETVAAQDRDVADLKERLATPLESPEEPAHPEPSLLPNAVRPTTTRSPGERHGFAHRPGEPADHALAPSDARRLAAALRPEHATLSDMDARRMAAIVEAFEADRVELHLQPVVSLPQRKIRFYEVLARLRLADETVLAPSEFLPLLEGLGHAAELDLRVTGRAISIARHLMARGSEAIVSVNLSPRAVEANGFLRTLARTLDAHADTAGRLVFELSQRCWRTLDAERAGALGALRDRGIPLALDRASDLRLDPLALADRGARFVKLPADLLLLDQDPGLDIETRDLATVLRRAGIKLVAEKVEREESVPDLIDLDVPLAQGFVFAAPRAVRSDVLGAPAQGGPAAAAPAEPPSEPPPGGGGRMPYRAFLRRAS